MGLKVRVSGAEAAHQRLARALLARNCPVTLQAWKSEPASPLRSEGQVPEEVVQPEAWVAVLREPSEPAATPPRADPWERLGA